MFSFWENGDEDLVLSSCSNCKLKYLGSWYFMVCIIYIKFKLKEEKPNDTLWPHYIFLNAMHLNLKAKGHFDMSNWLFPSIVLLQYKNIFKILPHRFSCSYSKKRTTTQFFHFTSNQHNPPMRNVMRILPVPKIM